MDLFNKKKLKNAEEEKIKLQQRIDELEKEKQNLEEEKIKKDTGFFSSMKKSYKDIEDKSNNLTESILDRITKISDNTNSKIFSFFENTIQPKIEKSGSFVLKEIEKLSKDANEYEIEEKLKENFDEGLFINSLIKGYVKMNYLGEIDRGSFLSERYKEEIWKSNKRIFEFGRSIKNGKVFYRLTIDSIPVERKVPNFNFELLFKILNGEYNGNISDIQIKK